MDDIFVDKKESDREKEKEYYRDEKTETFCFMRVYLSVWKECCLHGNGEKYEKDGD